MVEQAIGSLQRQIDRLNTANTAHTEKTKELTAEVDALQRQLDALQKVIDVQGEQIRYLQEKADPKQLRIVRIPEAEPIVAEAEQIPQIPPQARFRSSRSRSCERAAQRIRRRDL